MINRTQPCEPRGAVIPDGSPAHLHQRVLRGSAERGGPRPSALARLVICGKTSDRERAVAAKGFATLNKERWLLFRVVDKNDRLCWA